MFSGKKRKHSSPSPSDGYNTESEMLREFGYGKSLFKDSDDERYINSLKDLERERIISERHEKMQMVKEKLKLLREYRKSTGKKDGKTDALTDLRKKREMRVERQESSGSASSEQQSEESYSSSEREEDGESSEKRRGISFVELERVRVSRGELEKWYGELFNFEDTVVGAFVRVNIGEAGEKGGSQYKICEIVGLAQASQPYAFGTKKVDKELIVKHGKNKRNFKMIVISNSKFTPAEFSQWRNY